MATETRELTLSKEKRKLTLSKETLRTLSATALSQVAGGSGYTAPGPTGGCTTFYGCYSGVGNCSFTNCQAGMC